MQKKLWMGAAILFCGLTFTSCVDHADNPADQPQPFDPKGSEKFINEAWMDKNVKPGDDFYNYALGTWLTTSPDNDGGFQSNASTKQAKTLREYFMASSNPLAQHLVKNFKDTKRKKMDEVKTILDQMNIQKPKNAADVLNEIVRLRDKGFYPIIGSAVDGETNTHSFRAVVTLGQQASSAKNAIDMGATSALKKIIENILTEIDEIENPDLKITDEYVEQLMTRSENILKLEQKLFEYTVKQSEGDIAVPGLSPARETVESNRIATRRAGEASPFTLEGLKAAFNLGDKASFNDSKIFKEYLEGINAQLAGNDATALQTFYDYLRYQPICELGTFLPDDKNASGDDYSYTEKVETNDETRLYFSGLTSSIPLLANQLTLEKMRQLSTGKETCTTMLEEMRKLFDERLQKLDWLSDATRQAARTKLQKMKFFVGVPDQVYDAQFTLDEGNTLIQDMLQLYAQNHAIKEKLIGKKLEESPLLMLDISEWYGVHNAYYNPVTNSLNILPAFCGENILPANDEYTRYAVGVVFGHEMTHGFDSSGSNYDENGYYRNWWTDADKTTFVDKQNQLIALYNRLEAYPGQPANGTRTLTENMADYGGMELAYALFLKDMTAKGMSGEELDHACREFFLHYAKLWQAKLSLDMLKSYYNDVHSCHGNRIRGVVTLMDDWYRVFNVKDGKLFVEPEKRVKIW